MTSLARFMAAVCGMLVLADLAAAAAPAVGGVPAFGTVTLPDQGSPLLQLGRGDQVRVDVFANPDLTTVTSVADDGSIFMPLAGPVEVAGLSPDGAARRIEVALKTGQFLINPQVSVNVMRSLSQRVSVLGEVASPGRYVIESDSTVLDVIAMAGGLTERGSDIVYINRSDKNGVVQQQTVDISRVTDAAGMDGSAPFQALRGGDLIRVPKATFTITGHVSSPGEYRIEGRMQLFQAIARAGGLTPLGSASRVEIRRRGPDGKFVDMKGRNDTLVLPDDIIKVKERLF